MKRGKLGGIALGVFIVVVLICLWKCSVRVPTGYKAVTYHLNGGISKDTLDEGWHIVPPTVVKTSLYSIGIEQSYLTSKIRVILLKTKVLRLLQQMENPYLLIWNFLICLIKIELQQCLKNSKDSQARL